MKNINRIEAEIKDVIWRQTLKPVNHQISNETSSLVRNKVAGELVLPQIYKYDFNTITKRQMDITLNEQVENRQR